MPERPAIRVCVACAGPDGAFLESVELPAGATVADAIERSGIRRRYPDLDIRPDRLGIFSRKTSPESVLRDGDRVEIYRALRVDPKEARRRRAEASRGRRR